jgi:OOP family OmpA-OmpF porin
MCLCSRVLLLIAAAFSLATAFAEVLKPPPEMAFLSGQMKTRDDWVAEHSIWNEVKFPPMNGEENPMKRGEYWRMWGDVTTAKDGPDCWRILKPVFLKYGWTVVQERPTNPYNVVARYQQNGADVWTVMDFSWQRAEVKMIKIAPIPINLKLTPPAATPEKMASPEKGDFPYLSALPGSKFRAGSQDKTPFWVTPKGGQREMVASGSMHRAYNLDGLSNVLFVTAYKDALSKAGWDLLDEFNSADAMLLAHFTKNGRNVWANLHNNNDGYTFDVADAGAADLGANLKKDCHVALYGVLFDFNKSTLQPASDGVLQQAVAILAKDPALKVEVQGHTDNVGGDAPNQTLSEARARAVVDWLTKHGVAASRLSAKGYGKTVPVADNNNDEGRAKNRRVEIADPSCAPKQAKGK